MANLVLLPAEILFLIFELLQQREIKALRDVSRRISRVAAHYHFGRVVLWDTTGRQRIKRISAMLGSYMERTRSLHILAKFPIKREIDSAELAGVLSRPNVLKKLQISQYIPADTYDPLTRNTVPRLSSFGPATHALRSLSHIHLSGIRLTNPAVFQKLANLQSVSLDLGRAIVSAKNAYTYSESLDIVDALSNNCLELTSLTLSVDDASPELLAHIANKLPNLQGLHLVGSDTDGFIPTMAVYSRDVTQTILSVAIILGRFPSLCSFTLPFFLSAPLLPEWHATHNEHQTQTSFYLPPPSELVSAAQAAAALPNEAEQQQQNQTATPSDGLVPTYVYFPAIREACETLREACPSLQRMGWCVPSFCIDPRVALVGPTALRVLEWEYQRLDRDVEVDDDESMTNGMAPGYGSPPASGVGEESVDDGDDENGEEPEDMDEDTPEGVWAVASVRIGAASDESISTRFA